LRWEVDVSEPGEIHENYGIRGLNRISVVVIREVPELQL
jgi:hypothetical protein